MLEKYYHVRKIKNMRTGKNMRDVLNNLNPNLQMSELFFILKKDDGTILELGGQKYPIVKSNKLFNSLFTFENLDDSRDIPIEVYINSIGDVDEFTNFFEATKYNQKYKYKMDIHCNGKKYNANIITAERPLEITNIEDLYGTLTQPTATMKIELIMESPYFYGDYSYDVEIGGGTEPLLKYPLPWRWGDTNGFAVSNAQAIIPHIIENYGNENNGIIINIYSGKNLKNPRVINESTGFIMGFDMTANANDILEINTIEKTVHKNGKLMPNVKRLFDKWLMLADGINVISFDADSGAQLCKVNLKFYNKYRVLRTL